MLRSFAPRLGGVLAAAALTLVLVPSVLAKEGVEVSLAAPISADAQPGDTVDVFFTLTAMNDQGTGPLRGSPVFIRLTGPTGAVTQADGVEQRAAGVYKASIVIPAGGAARAVFGLHGAKTDADGRTSPSDVVWPYDGILVSAQPPVTVDPNDFQVPTVTNPGVQVPKYAVEPVLPPATATTVPVAEPTIDPRAIGGVAIAALVALAVGLLLRRRIPRPTTA